MLCSSSNAVSATTTARSPTGSTTLRRDSLRFGGSRSARSSAASINPTTHRPPLPHTIVSFQKRAASPSGRANGEPRTGWPRGRATDHRGRGAFRRKTAEAGCSSAGRSRLPGVSSNGSYSQRPTTRDSRLLVSGSTGNRSLDGRPRARHVLTPDVGAGIRKRPDVVPRRPPHRVRVGFRAQVRTSG